MEPMTQSLSIGELAKLTDCKVPTVRFYEGRGLMPEPSRSAGGQRRYRGADVQRLRFIRHSRELGFDLSDIEELLALESQGGHADDIAKRQLEQVKHRIKRLRSLQRELGRMLTSCNAEEDRSCQIIDVLANHELCGEDHS